MIPIWKPAALLLTGALFVASSARADIVFPAPTDCPPGSVGATHHGGPHCAADLCADEPGRCAASGGNCQEHGLCTEQRQGASRGGPFTYAAVVGVCDPGGNCAQGKCEKLKVCVPAAGEGEPAGGAGAPAEDEAPAKPADEAPAKPADESAGEPSGEGDSPGCHLGGGTRGVAGALWLALVAVAGVAARRR